MSATAVPYEWILKKKSLGVLCQNNKTTIPLLLVQDLMSLFKLDEKEFTNKDLKTGKIPLITSENAEIEDVHLTCNMMAFACHKISSYTPFQYVLSFDAPLVVHNYLPYFLELDCEHPHKKEKTLGLINSQEAFETCALDGEDFKNSKIKWKIHIEEESYYECDTWSSILKPNEPSEHKLKFNYCEESKEETKKRSALELKATVRPNSKLINKYGSFELRDKVFEYCTSKKIVLFARYAIVNKTDSSIYIGSKGKTDFVLKKHTSEFIDLRDNTKLSFSVKGFGTLVLLV